MTPKELRSLIEKLKNENNLALTSINELMQKRNAYSSMSIEEREIKKDDISKLNDDIDTLMQAIEDRNKEIERYDKLLSLQTNSSMNKRNTADNLYTSDSDNESELRTKVDRWFRIGNNKYISKTLKNTIESNYIVKKIMANINIYSEIRKKSNIISVINEYTNIGIPHIDDVDNLDWTSEIEYDKENTNTNFYKREMKTNQLTKIVLISKILTQQSNIDISKLVIDRIAYKLGGTLEHTYLYGNGNDKPLGIFAQTSDNSAAIPTDRDIAVGTETAAITYDGLVDAVKGLKKVYQHGAVWMLNKEAVAALRKLKDKQDRPLWQESLIAGQPSLILGIPVIQNDFIEDKLEATKYFGVLANLNHYWIMDSLSMELQVLYELYSKTNQVGFQAVYWGDGAPVQKEAFVRLVAHDKPFAKAASQPAG